MANRICTIEGCQTKQIARGWCSMHYQRWKSKGDPLLGERRRNVCSLTGCHSLVVAWGWCEKHYNRWKRHGNPLVTSRIVGDDVARFETYLTQGSTPAHALGLGPCWLWTGGTDQNGYGKFRAGDEQFAHRWSYTFHIGDIPTGCELDHLCRLPRCVNAWHLDPVTHVINVLRAAEVRYGSDQPNVAPRGAVA